MRALFLLAALLPAGAGTAAPLSPGMHAGSLRLEGRERRYRYRVPSNYPKQKTAPVLIVLHASRYGVEHFEEMTGGELERLSDREGFLLVYAEAWKKYWNDERKNTRVESVKLNIDDIGFFEALIARAVDAWRADPKRVYMAGLAQGGMMAQRFACERPGTLAGLASVSGPIAKPAADACPSRLSAAVLLIHGTKDPFYRWEDTTTRLGGSSFGERLALPAALSFWTGRLGCRGEPKRSDLPDKDPRDKTTVRLHAYRSCAGGNRLHFYEVKGGGHAWPGGAAVRPEWISGPLCRDFAAGAAIWDFFKAAR